MKKSCRKARIIVATASLSLLAFVLAINFSTPEKKLEHVPLPMSHARISGGQAFFRPG